MRRSQAKASGGCLCDPPRWSLLGMGHPAEAAGGAVLCWAGGVDFPAVLTVICERSAGAPLAALGVPAAGVPVCRACKPSTGISVPDSYRTPLQVGCLELSFPGSCC